IVALTTTSWAFNTKRQESEWDKHTSAGLSARQAGQFKEAERELQAALKEAEAFDQSDSRLAESLSNLADLYGAQGNYSQAMQFESRLLAVRERVLGPNHPVVAIILVDLGNMEWRSGKFVEAQSTLKRALAIREKLFGEEHPEVAQCLNYLASI